MVTREKIKPGAVFKLSQKIRYDVDQYRDDEDSLDPHESFYIVISADRAEICLLETSGLLFKLKEQVFKRHSTQIWSHTSASH